MAACTHLVIIISAKSVHFTWATNGIPYIYSVCGVRVCIPTKCSTFCISISNRHRCRSRHSLHCIDAFIQLEFVACAASIMPFNQLIHDSIEDDNRQRLVLEINHRMHLWGISKFCNALDVTNTIENDQYYING